MQTYKKGIIVILLLSTILNAVMNLSFENMCVVSIMSVLSGLYVVTRQNTNGINETCSTNKNILHQMRDNCIKT